MTSNQYRSHQEQVEAANKEFWNLWPKIMSGQDRSEISRDESVRLQHLCWKTFLHAKGLA